MLDASKFHMLWKHEDKVVPWNCCGDVMSLAVVALSNGGYVALVGA